MKLIFYQKSHFRVSISKVFVDIGEGIFKNILQKRCSVMRSLQSISTDAKVLYSLLLDRNSLSIRNDWIDKRGKYFQYFTIEECKEKLNFGHDKVVKLFKELEMNELITRKRQGQGKPSIIYV